MTRSIPDELLSQAAELIAAQLGLAPEIYNPLFDRSFRRPGQNL